MTPLLERLPTGARVLVIRLRSLGDCVLTTPALHLLKSHRPDLCLGVVVEDRFRGVFEGNPGIDTILGPSKGEALSFRPKLVINLHGGSRSVMLAVASMARWRAGYDHLPVQWIYNVPIPTAQAILGVDRTVHTAEHVASAMFYLGVPLVGIPRAQLFTKPSVEHAPYAVLHPFASAASKAWPAERFAAAACAIESRHGLRPVVIGARGDDFTPFNGFNTMEGGALSEVKSLLSGARLFLGNDSGPAHIAAAFGVPVTALFGDSNPAIWSPWRTESEVLHRPHGIQSLTIEEVLDTVKRLLLRT